MRAAWALAGLFVLPAFAGCLATDPLETASVPPVGALLAQPWLENWQVVGMDLAFDYDPAALALSGEGTLTVENALGEDRGYVLLYMGGYEVAYVRDEAGADLPFEVTRFAPVLTQLVPVADDVSPMLVASQVVNVTLSGEVAHGTRRTLSLAWSGWDSDATNAAGAGREFGAHFHSIAPVATGKRTEADVRFTIRSPVDWTVLAAAYLENLTVEGDTQVAAYRNLDPRVLVFSSDGLLFHEDYVDGIQVRTYYYPDMAPQGRAMHDGNLRILRHLPIWTGPYPFDHMWTVPHQVTANAFNTPALSFMGWTFYRPGLPGAPVQFGRDGVPVVAGESGYEAVLVHEQTHNWWGQMFRGNNSDAELSEKDTWMSEGVTTYLSELVYWDRIYSEDAARESADHMVRDQERDRLRRNGEERAITEDGGDHYVKTALALRALEGYAIATGRPDAVLDALKLTMERLGRQHGGPGLADTPEVLAIFEESFGEDLSWWWEPWFYGRELADLRVASATRDGANLTVVVENAGDAGAAALVEARTLLGQTVRAWTVVPAGETAEASLDLTGVDDAVVLVKVDPLQHVGESDERNNAWVGRA